MNETIEYLVKDGNFFRRTSNEVKLGPLTDIVKKAQSDGYTIIPDLFTLKMPSKHDYENDTYETEQKMNVHVARSGTSIHVAHRIPYFPIFGFFDFHSVLKNDPEKPEENGLINFSASTATGHRKIKVGCEYPSLWMIYCFRLQNHRVQGFQQVYMVTNIKGRHYAPLLPNVFDNGKICLGEVQAKWNGNIEDCVIHLFNEIFISFSNDHLLSNHGWDILLFEYERKENKNHLIWKPPSEFIENPVPYHTERGTSIAAEFLQIITEIEKTDNSPKIKA